MDINQDSSKDEKLLYKNNKYYYLVDSLPFVDTVPVELEPKIKELVDDEMKLILDESGCTESELLDKYLGPLPFNFKESDTLFNKELNRIRNGEEKQSLDFTKYSSVGEHKDTKSKLNHMKMLMEYSQDSLINLELMDRYKEGSWLKHLDSLTLLKLRMENYKNKVDAMLGDLNKRRKLAQIETANRLRSINNEYEDLKTRNMQLFSAIEKLRKS